MTPEEWEYDRLEAEAVRNRQEALKLVEDDGKGNEDHGSVGSTLLTFAIVVLAALVGFLAGNNVAAF